MQNFLQDVRYGLRMLAKSPGLTLVAVLTLALGIGANTAIFSVINALFLHPPGIGHPDRVVTLRAKYTKLGLNNIVVSVPDYAQVRDSPKVFASAALETDADFNYTGGARPERLRGVQVSWQWFDVFEARPILGRVFTSAEDQPHMNHEIVLAYGAWQRWFGGDSGIVGRSIQLNQQTYRVVGVMGPAFQWPSPQVDLWSPLGLEAAAFSPDNTFNENYFAVARLQPGVSFAQANSFTGVLAQRVINDPRASFAKDAQWGLFLMPISDYVFGNLRTPILILAGAVAFVLLIACANIAGLLLAKATGRSKELAVRAALGASRGRIMAQTLTENAVLGFLGVAAGLLVAQFGTSALLLAAPPDLAEGATFALDRFTLLFTALVGIASVLIFGIAPVWHMSRIDPYNALRESGRSSTGSHGRQQLRSLLVAGELALGLILLAGTGLLLQSLTRINQVNPGFQPHHVMTAALTLPEAQYGTPEKQIAFFRTVLDHVSSAPGVTAAGAGYPLPFATGNSSASFEIEGQPLAAGEPGPHGDIRYVTGGYFTALGIPLLKGRIFTADDRMGTQQAAVIDENLARQYWPNQDPIGKRIRNGGPKGSWSTIVGVVGHIRFSQLAGEETYSGSSQSAAKGVYYLCLNQAQAPFGFLIAKTTGDPSILAGVIREAVRDADRNQPLSEVKTMDTRISESLGPQRFAAKLLAVFAGLAILLSAVGLYGLISYSVAQRTSEIGLRMALGADSSEVLRLVMGQGARLLAAGAVVGIAAGLVLVRSMQSLLYGVSAADPLAFLGATALLGLIALVACYIPARRAMRVDPIVALRCE